MFHSISWSELSGDLFKVGFNKLVEKRVIVFISCLIRVDSAIALRFF